MDEYQDILDFSLLAVKDMNRDGMAEIVFLHEVIGQLCGSMNALTCETDTHIVEWDGQKFEPLVLELVLEQYYDYDAGLYDFIHTNYGRYLVTDTDSNGTFELLLEIAPEVYIGTGSGWLGSYPVRIPEIEIWAWNGQAFTLARTEVGPPVFRIHAILDGDNAAWIGDYSEALASYQRAIFDETLMSWGPYQNGTTPQQRLGDPDERPRLSAYARYRILLLHIIQGHLPEAQVVYDTLQSQFPAGAVGRPYAELATIFWQEHQASQNIAAACAQAIAYASSHEKDILVPLGRDFYDPGDHGGGSPFYPRHVTAQACSLGMNG